MNKIRAIFYDLDNTLYPQIVDVEQRIDYCIKKFKFHNGDSIKKFWMEEWIINGPKKNNLIDKVIEKFNLNINKEQILNAYRTYRTRLSLCKEVVELLKEIKDQGILQFVITNGNPIIQQNKIDALQLNYFFNEIIIAEGRYAKPSSYWFNKLMKKYNVKPNDCISIGDWYNIDGIASQSAGISFIYIEGGPIIEEVPSYIVKIKKLVEIKGYIKNEK
jgi:putative hydrolase of the HAD superfamily